MLIKNGIIYQADHQFAAGDIRIIEERIEEVGEKLSPRDAEEILDADGAYILPGLVDVHVHGAVNYDFCDARREAFEAISSFEADRGVLAVCATTMTLPEENLGRVADEVSSFHTESGADIIGINLEGPFFSPDRIGAQNPEYLAEPDAGMIRRINERANGMVKLLDLAPELPGAMECIKTLKDDMVVSIAHTTCDYETAAKAFDAGANHLTHLYNAMPSLHHRSPGPIPAAAEAGAYVEMIADGIHIHPAMVRLAFSLFGGERVVLISDSLRACGLENGIYDLGGQEVRVEGGRASLVRDPDVLAGSATCLYDCMKIAIREMGIPKETAIRAATENPARSIGVEKDYGSIAKGRFGNLVICDPDFTIIDIIKKGRKLKGIKA